MINWLDPHRDDRRKARDIYDAVVAQSRAPVFYARLGVSDTMVGRYEMIALHLALLIERLGAADVAAEDIRRLTVETFVTDMDDGMRELGIGDTSVPRNVKKAAAGLMERGLMYRAALVESDDQELCTALRHYVYGGSATRAEARVEPDAADVARLARYVRALVADLAAQSPEALRVGTVRFLTPAAGGLDVRS